MERVLRRWGFGVLGLLAMAVFARAGENATQRIVVFAPGTTAAQRLEAVRASGSRVVRELPLINAVVVETPAAKARPAGPRGEVGVEDAFPRQPEFAGAVRVDNDEEVNWLQSVAAPADFVLPNMATLNAGFARLRGMAAAEAPDAAASQIPWGVARVQAPQVWGESRGKGVDVCVIDTGISRDHPDLAANIKGGWNILTNADDFNDDNGHGTHVSGTIAAVGDAGGVIGVAPQVNLYGVKVLNANGGGKISDIVAGMQWAADHHMQVVNMSVGGPFDRPALADATAALVKAGVVLVAAAGNYNPVTNPNKVVLYPAAYPQAIAVAASDANGALADYSAQGPAVALIAPGSNIDSTYLNGGYQTLSGTSMASPHVAGLAALYLATHPGATPGQVRAALTASASPLSGVPANGQGAGFPTAPSLIDQAVAFH